MRILPDGLSLILASSSPRRAELLTAAGFRFETVVTDIDEHRRPGETPSAYVRRLAKEKSDAALRRIEQAQARGGNDLIVLGADTAVVIDGKILGKPLDDRDSEAMLRSLSGRRHDVLTGVSLRRTSITARGPHLLHPSAHSPRAGGPARGSAPHSTREFGASLELGRVETTAVYFNALSEGDLAWYVASGEGRDKAGGYAIQGLASRFIPRIDGSYSNVVGLPVALVVELMAKLCSGQRLVDD